MRGFQGWMLFPGDDAMKKVNVLSGVNALILDESTNHLDLESITLLNNGLVTNTNRCC